MTCRVECNTPFVFLNYIQLQLPPHLQSPVHARFACYHPPLKSLSSLKEFWLMQELFSICHIPLLPCAILQRVFMVNIPYNVHSLDCFQLFCDVRGKNIIKVIFKGLSCAWFQHLNYDSPIKNYSIDSGLCGAWLELFVKHLIRSAFCPPLSWPVSDSEGGQG